MERWAVGQSKLIDVPVLHKVELPSISLSEEQYVNSWSYLYQIGPLSCVKGMWVLEQTLYLFLTYYKCKNNFENVKLQPLIVYHVED